MLRTYKTQHALPGGAPGRSAVRCRAGLRHYGAAKGSSGARISRGHRKNDGLNGKIWEHRLF